MDTTGRRAFLAGALGTLSVAVAGCGTPSATETRTPAPGPSSNGGASASPVTPQPTSAATPATPSPTPTRTQPPSAKQIIQRATVPVLCYHQLRNWTSNDTAYNRANLICPPKNFRRHLDALVDGGWTTITPDQYLAHLTTGAALPRKPVMLSFDDGTAGQAREGLPQLAKRGLTGTFFVMTVVLDKPHWLSTRDVKRMAAAGMTIGSHTYDHQAVTDLSGRDWKVQLEQSRETLRKASGQSVRHFAYPYGTVSREAYRHLKSAGYRTAFQLTAKPLDARAPLYTLRRLIVVSTWSGSTLVKHLSKRP